MTDSGFRALMAAIIARAVDDVRKGVQPNAAYNWLRGEYAGQMFQELGIDQGAAVEELCPIADAYRQRGGVSA